MKTELEEAADEYFKLSHSRLINEQQKEYERELFIAGAKWMQEQILEFLYLEITERRPYSASKMCEVVIEFIEQYKKK